MSTAELDLVFRIPCVTQKSIICMIATELLDVTPILELVGVRCFTYGIHAKLICHSKISNAFGSKVHAGPTNPIHERSD